MQKILFKKKFIKKSNPCLQVKQNSKFLSHLSLEWKIRKSVNNHHGCALVTDLGNVWLYLPWIGGIYQTDDQLKKLRPKVSSPTQKKSSSPTQKGVRFPHKCREMNSCNLFISLHKCRGPNTSLSEEMNRWLG